MTMAQPASAQSYASQRKTVSHWKTANPLFDAIVGGGSANTKAACIIAAQIEEDLIGRSWPTGTIYGSETHLESKFGVCRSVVREAVRILESRGTARMRRGPNGGLLILAPSMSLVLEAIDRYVTSHCRELHRGKDGKTILQAVHARLIGPGAKNCVGPGLASFLEEMISAVNQHARQGPSGRIALGATVESARSRAQHIFRLLMKDLNSSRAIDRRLGSELDLCDRYGADRDVLRQAVRVLEFEGIAESVAGRGKGLMTRTPEPAALCRLINCYFTAARVTPSDAMSLFKLLSVEAISIAAEDATDEELARLKNAQRLLHAADVRMTAKVMQEAEESQFGIIDEPLVDILLRCTKSYSTWWSSLRNPQSEQLDIIYRTETIKVISALLERDVTAVAAAQAAKVERLNGLILNQHRAVSA